MNLKRAEEIVTFLKKLSTTEMSFVRHILHETMVKRVRVADKKHKKNGKYTPKQIKKAWALLKKGVSAKEIARRTHMTYSHTLKGGVSKEKRKC